MLIFKDRRDFIFDTILNIWNIQFNQIIPKSDLSKVLMPFIYRDAIHIVAKPT